MAVALAAGGVLAKSGHDGDTSWPAVTSESRPWTRWWWLGSAVDEENLSRELEAIAAAGFGGVEITPIYGAKGAEGRFLKFLSPEYVAMTKVATPASTGISGPSDTVNDY
jgi:hypothetical protein